MKRSNAYADLELGSRLSPLVPFATVGCETVHAGQKREAHGATLLFRAVDLVIWVLIFFVMPGRCSGIPGYVQMKLGDSLEVLRMG